MTIEEQIKDIHVQVQTHELVLHAMLLAVGDILKPHPEHRRAIRDRMLQVMDQALMNELALDTAINQSRELIETTLRD